MSDENTTEWWDIDANLPLYTRDFLKSKEYNQLRASKSVLAERERELFELKGPCSESTCSLHYAHSGPCDIKRNETE